MANNRALRPLTFVGESSLIDEPDEANYVFVHTRSDVNNSSFFRINIPSRRSEGVIPARLPHLAFLSVVPPRVTVLSAALQGARLLCLEKLSERTTTPTVKSTIIFMTWKERLVFDSFYM